MQNSSYKPSLVEGGRTSFNLGQCKDLTATALIILQSTITCSASQWLSQKFCWSVYSIGGVALPLHCQRMGAKAMNWSLFSFGFNKCSQIFKTILYITKVDVKFEPSTVLTDFDRTLLKITSRVPQSKSDIFYKLFEVCICLIFLYIVRSLLLLVLFFRDRYRERRRRSRSSSRHRSSRRSRSR